MSKPPIFVRLALPLAIAATALLPSCLSMDPAEEPSPDIRLELLLSDLRDVRGGEFAGKSEASGEEGRRREGFLVSEIRGLALRYPRHVPILVANASLAYEDNDPIAAQRYLDQALNADPTHVGALLLRVRVAVEAGNLPFARRKLLEQLDITPDDPRLHEAFGGLLYLSGDHETALEELELARRLREDRDWGWRLSYHRGLVAEALGERERATALYEQCLEENPDFEPALRRKRWLESLDVPVEPRR